jgi:DNA-binding NtrC family response regulator
MMRSDSNRITALHLELVLRESGVAQLAAAPVAAAPDPAATAATPRIAPLADQVAELERKAIALAMTATRGNKVAAAHMLGISRAMLYDRLGKNA